MFKCLQFIDDELRQLNEVGLQMISEAEDSEQNEDDTTENTDEESEGSNEETPVTKEGGEMTGDATSNPSQIANVDQGQFVSNLGDAEYASIMIRALASNPAFKDKIPQEFLNAQTTENAQQIIQFCKTLLGLQQAGGESGFNTMTDEEVMNIPA